MNWAGDLTISSLIRLYLCLFHCTNHVWQVPVICPWAVMWPVAYTWRLEELKAVRSQASPLSSASSVFLRTFVFPLLFSVFMFSFMAWGQSAVSGCSWADSGLVIMFMFLWLQCIYMLHWTDILKPILPDPQTCFSGFLVVLVVLRIQDFCSIVIVSQKKIYYYWGFLWIRITQICLNSSHFNSLRYHWNYDITNLLNVNAEDWRKEVLQRWPH